MNTILLKSNDIECDGCKNSITRAVSTLTGVTSVEVNVGEKSVEVKFDEPATEGQIRETITGAGFAIEN